MSSKSSASRPPPDLLLGLVETPLIDIRDHRSQLQEKAERAKVHRDFNRMRARQTGRGGLIHFVRDFWDVLEPATKLVDGWPLEAICMHLEAVTFGEINRLLINVPPTGAVMEVTKWLKPLVSERGARRSKVPPRSEIARN